MIHKRSTALERSVKYFTGGLIITKKLNCECYARDISAYMDGSNTLAFSLKYVALPCYQKGSD